MKTMFILRGPSYCGPGYDAQGIPNHSGKPNGMMIRATDNLFTDNKAAAKLFDTSDDARDHYLNVLLPSWTDPVSQGHMIFIVEVEVKPVVHKVTKNAVLIK